MDILGVILAGGKSLRMEGVNKAELMLGPKRLVDVVYERLSSQVSETIINAPKDYGLNIPFVPDDLIRGQGPLAGIYASLKWVKENRPETKAIVTVPVDCPFFPKDYVIQITGQNQVKLVEDGSGIHPVFGYWPLSILDELERYLKNSQKRAVRAFTSSIGNETHLFSEDNAFFNINSRADYKKALEFMADK